MEGRMKRLVAQRAQQLLASLVLILCIGSLASVLNAQKPANTSDHARATGTRIKGPTLLVANKHSNTLSFVNPQTLEVIETIATGPNPHEIPHYHWIRTKTGLNDGFNRERCHVNHMHSIRIACLGFYTLTAIG